MTALVVLVVSVGWLIRSTAYFQQPALWIDEARLALNIVSRSWIDLLSPLDHDQTAPLAFLWLVRATVALLGVNDLALRLVPFLASLALLPALYLVGRRYVGTSVALMATAFAAVSPQLVEHANEVKQYETDALAAVGVLVLLQLVRDAPTARRAWVKLGLGGLGLLTFSHPAVFTLGGGGLGLWADRRVRRATGAVLRWTLVAGLWLAGFALLYALSYRSVQNSQYMEAFWGGTYLSPSAPNLGLRLWFAGRSMLQAPLPDLVQGLSLRFVAVFVALGGFTLALQKRWDTLAILIGPALLAVAAAMLSQYPPAPRLVLFAVPAVLLLAASPLGFAADRFAGTVRYLRVMMVAAILLLGFPRLRAVWMGPAPRDGKDLIRYYEHQPGRDPVYIYAGATPAWAFYTTDWRAPDLARLGWVTDITRSDGPGFANHAPRGSAVLCEGDDLVYRDADHLELYGIGTGARVTEPFRGVPGQPDPGWAVNEARRVARAANPRVWVLALNHYRPWLAELLDAIAQRGGRIEARISGSGRPEGAELILFRFDAEVGSMADDCGGPRVH